MVGLQHYTVIGWVNDAIQQFREKRKREKSRYCTRGFGVRGQMSRQTVKMEGSNLTIYGSIVRDKLHKSQRRKSLKGGAKRWTKSIVLQYMKQSSLVLQCLFKQMMRKFKGRGEDGKWGGRKERGGKCCSPLKRNRPFDTLTYLTDSPFVLSLTLIKYLSG